jgi:PadR family transcriptional regulator, regulatory protein PadR
MSRLAYLGDFELLVMFAVMRLSDRAYGVTVKKDIADRSSRDVSLGAIYSTLDRLEAKGYVRSKLGEPTAERGGRPKRFYVITAAGDVVLTRTRESLLKMMRGLDFSGRSA